VLPKKKKKGYGPKDNKINKIKFASLWVSYLGYLYIIGFRVYTSILIFTFV
jgi:hypothetical protein